ncbi:MAG: glutamate dehydrogenase [Nonlabens sp.]
MRNLVRIFVVVVISTVGFNQTVQSQNGYTHEIGVFFGPLAFQGDYGERGDFDTNSGNVGIGGGFVHYLNFPYAFDSYFNDHFKIKTEISYHTTTLNNFGPTSEKQNLGGRQLREMTGKAKVFEIGPSLEYHFNSIRDFEAGQSKFSPYLSLGFHYVNFAPEATSTLGPLNNPVTTFPTFLDRIDTSPGSTLSIVGDIGFRYKINRVSDLTLSSKWHYYLDNYVDGLSPDNPNNRANDWIWWVNLGYVYYLEYL